MHNLQGPILILGAGGFIGSAIFRTLLTQRNDIMGTVHNGSIKRLEGANNWIDIDVVKSVEYLLAPEYSKFGTVINCVAYGSHPNETDPSKIYATNFDLVQRILNKMPEGCIYVHAGTSSEYGFNSAGPKEDSKLTPNSDYAVSKAAASQLIEYYGKHKGKRCCNLRLYSVYGPYEDSSRLIPTLVASAVEKKLPKFVHPAISRDFVYIDDVVEAFLVFAARLTTNKIQLGESYNICTGMCTSMSLLAAISRTYFGIQDAPEYTMEPRAWDAPRPWYGNPGKTYEFWRANTMLQDGLLKTMEWYKGRST
jgi:polyisoprenyl-phosphate glycosyltransferase